MKKETLLWLCFLMVAFIIFSNLNGLVRMLIGITAPFSSLILVGCLVIGYYLFRYQRITFPHHCFNICVIGYFVVGWISWFFFHHLHGDNSNLLYYHIARKQAPAILLVYVFYKFVLYQGHKGNLNRILFAIVLMMLVITLTIPFGSYIGLKEAIDYDSPNRESGFFSNPNMAGAHINYTLSLVLFFVLNSKRKIGFLVFLMGVPIIIYAALTTFSKSTMIMAALICLMFLFINTMGILKMGGTRRARLSLLLAALVGVGIMIAPQIPNYLSQLGNAQLSRLLAVNSILSGEINDDTTTLRTGAWAEGAELIIQYPSIGFGFGSFNGLPKTGFGVHNVYLMVFGEAGILPFTALMLFVLSTYWRIIFWVRNSSYKFLALSLFIVITVQVFGAAHTGMRNSELLCVLGLVFALIELTKAEEREPIASIRNEA